MQSVRIAKAVALRGRGARDNTTPRQEGESAPYRLVVVAGQPLKLHGAGATFGEDTDEVVAQPAGRARGKGVMAEMVEQPDLQLEKRCRRHTLAHQFSSFRGELHGAVPKSRLALGGGGKYEAVHAHLQTPRPTRGGPERFDEARSGPARSAADRQAGLVPP